MTRQQRDRLIELVMEAMHAAMMYGLRYDYGDVVEWEAAKTGTFRAILDYTATLVEGGPVVIATVSVGAMPDEITTTVDGAHVVVKLGPEVRVTLTLAEVQRLAAQLETAVDVFEGHCEQVSS